jgi:hypothetical protein
MTDRFVGAAQSRALTVRPPNALDNSKAFRIRMGEPSESGPTADWQAFRSAFFHVETRNAFYCGHGSADGIGHNPANTNRFISRQEIESVLHTVPAGQTNRHGFRFVFLDGCQTADGHLPEAFGIVRKKNLPVDYYIASGERLSSFVGWNTSPTASFFTHAVYVDHFRFMENFVYRWSTDGEGLRQALNNSKNGPLHLNLNVDPDDLTVFGYRDLGYNQDNSH